MNTKELFDLIKARKRMCESQPTCLRCPLRFTVCRLDSDLEDIDDLERMIRTVKEWDAAHPALEEVGKGIYYDPKHRIVPDEITRVYTIELTVVSANYPVELTADDLKEFGNDAATAILRDEYFDYVVDARCIRTQQFVTKCHEEEV